MLFEHYLTHFHEKNLDTLVTAYGSTDNNQNINCQFNFEDEERKSLANVGNWREIIQIMLKLQSTLYLYCFRKRLLQF